MKTVIFEVCPLNDAIADMRRRLASGKPDRHARITFVSFDLMWKVLAPNRWRLIETLTGAGPLGVRELARRVGRDVRAVHTDAQALATAGVIDKTAEGKLHFPYEAVHVDFVLRAA